MRTAIAEALKTEALKEQAESLVVLIAKVSQLEAKLDDLLSRPACPTPPTATTKAK